MGVPFTALLAVVLMAGVLVARSINRRLAAAMAAADRDDPFWRLNDLLAHREAVPDSENSALVVAKALARLPKNWPWGPVQAPGARSLPPTAASQAYERMKETRGNVRLAEADIRTLRAELDRYREALQVARTVAGYARGRNEVTLSPGLINTYVPETSAASLLARFLATDAAIRAQDGDLDGSLDSCRAILATARSIGDEPLAISQLVRRSIGTVAMRSLRRALGQGEPSDAALARIQRLILDEMRQPLSLYAMRGERATLDEMLRRTGAGEMPLRDEATRWVSRNLGARWNPWFDHQRAVGLEWMNEAVAITRRPAAARPPLWAAWQARIAKTEKSRLGVLGAILPLLSVPTVSTLDTAHSRYQAELGATAILIAAERHRRKTGDWPASIAAIDPAILPSTPVDPCSGQPYHMGRRRGFLLIYSVGHNLKDEHGAYDARRAGETGPDDVGSGAWDVPVRRQPAREAER